MNMLGRTGFDVSKIGLGTAEIGLAYGLGAKTPPSEAEAERILRSAVEMGITYIDTARGYGLAEERIGKSGISKLDHVVIGTKCGQFLKDEPDLHGGELERRIRADIDASRKMLRQDRLQLLQLHIERPDFTDFRELSDVLDTLIHEGAVAHVGVSTRGEAAPLAAFDFDTFETSQLAYNILDQRMRARVIPAAQKRNIGIIARSVFLKGALTPSVGSLPDALGVLKGRAREITGIASEFSLDLPSMAIRFVASDPAISTVLVGTTDPGHVRTALTAVDAGPLPGELLEKLYALAIDDPQQVDPALWPAI